MELSVRGALQLLSDQDAAERLAAAEQTIAAGRNEFVRTGLTMMAIRDESLWKGSHPSWDAYCLAKTGQPAAFVDRAIQEAQAAAAA